MTRFFDFDDFRVDAAQRLLTRGGQPVALKPKTFDLLLVLVENGGRVIEKEELMRALWPGQIVEEGNLTQHVSRLRKALGDDRDVHRYIVTLPGRGYQFIAPVKSSDSDENDHAEGAKDGAPPMVEQAAQGASPPDSEARAAPPHPAPPTWVRTRGPRGFILALVALGLAAVAIAIWRGRAPRQPAGDAERFGSIAILPFKTADAGGGDEYLGVGLTDSLISRFARLQEVFVRPTSAVLKYGGEGQDPMAAGRELQVDVVLDGVARREGERVRVTARLLRVRDGTPVWARTFDEKWTDIFAVQDMISAEVSEALALSLTEDERRQLSKRSTNNAEAYKLYLEANYIIGRDEKTSALEKSAEYYQRAIELDPNFAPAYIGLEQVYAVGFPPLTARQRLLKVRELALTALKVDPTLGEAYATLAATKCRLDWDWAGAEEDYKRAVELSPGDAFTHSKYGGFLVSQGRVGEGIPHIERAYEIDPTSASVGYLLGVHLVYARRYAEAFERFNNLLVLNPNMPTAYSGLGLAYESQGRHAEAIEALEKAVKLQGYPGSSTMWGRLGQAYALAGRRADASKAISELEKLQGHDPLGGEALVYAGLGDKDRAFDCLDKAVEGHEWWAFFVKVEPGFDSLRSDPRFDELIRRTGLTP
ncbi:MAG TPA: tetratricopeptide repeat protein [Pyrinomonadaceae bacterium]|jgi:DNA-binding winged helix-turn-helix (wHTH) protein/TolB-like protein/cytochrome c-type biogenesis protein CcmH/NrfG|nr:tetratricopeptide repeat protein [Pyrinomonadaceae bacterium]